jgi:predicted nucleic acid-binding protein
MIPPEVPQELTAKGSDAEADLFSAETSTGLIAPTPKAKRHLQGLHPGETAAIALAKELKAEFLIMDEKPGRKIAAREHLPILGTIGVLERAAADLLDLAATFEQFKQTNFHISPLVIGAAATATAVQVGLCCRTTARQPMA